MSEHDYFEAWWKKQELGHKADYESDRALRTVALSGWLARSVLTPLPEGREQVVTGTSLAMAAAPTIREVMDNERASTIEQCARVCDECRVLITSEPTADAAIQFVVIAKETAIELARQIRLLKQRGPQPQLQKERP